MNVNYFIASVAGSEARVLLTLFVMFLAAKILAELFERLRQPAVAGEILAGVLIGPSVLALTTPSEPRLFQLHLSAPCPCQLVQRAGRRGLMPQGRSPTT